MAAHIHFTRLEDAIIRNKWFTLTCVTLLFAAFAYVNSLTTSNEFRSKTLQCHDVAVDIIRNNGYNVEAWRAAKAQFSTCLLVRGINPNSIPLFEDMFPYPTEQDDAYGAGQSDQQYDSE